MTVATLRDATASLAADAIAVRRDLHRHPELGFQEFRTSQLVADRLRTLGLEVQTGIAGTGVIGLLRGARHARRPRCRHSTWHPPRLRSSALPSHAPDTARDGRGVCTTT